MRKLSAVFAILLSLVMVLSIMPAPARAAQTGEAYEQLPSDMHKQAYHILDEGIASLAPVITFPEDMVIYSYDLTKIAHAVCVDHPEYFWFLESWYYNFESEISKRRVTYLTPSYFLDGERVSAGSQELADATVVFHQKVNEIITGIPVNCNSQYEIALYLHDYLVDHVTYSLEGNHDSAYSALVHGEAACYGYSKAYQYLLTLAGVRARTIIGKSVDPDGKEIGHAWNQVWIDDICYYTDVTWDDWDFTGIHAYFLCSQKMFSKEHVPDINFILPDCSHAINYHEVSSGYGAANLNKHSKPEEAAQHFVMTSQKGKTAVFSCEIRFDGNFASWLNTWIPDIARNLNLSKSTSFEYYYKDDVYYVILTDTNYSKPTEEVTSITLNLSDVALPSVGAQAKLQAQTVPASGQRDLIYRSSDASVATVSGSGMITAVGTGDATITVTDAGGNVNATCSVTVTEGEVHIHSVRNINESDPSCTQDGSDSYFRCVSCGRRFADEDATKEITSVTELTRPATGHQDVSWKTDRRIHVKVCSCTEEIADTYGMHEDADKNMRCDVCNHPLPSLAVENAGMNKAANAINIISIVLGAVLVIGMPLLIFIIKRRR